MIMMMYYYDQIVNSYWVLPTEFIYCCVGSCDDEGTVLWSQQWKNSGVVDLRISFLTR